MREKSWYWWVVFLVYFGLVAAVSFNWTLAVMWWFFGGVLGVGFEYADRLIYVFVTKPHEQLSLQVRHLTAQGRYRDALKLLRFRKTEQRQLTVKSVLFVVVWIPLALFVVTSTASSLAQGFVMGVGLHLLYEIGMDWQDQEKLRGWLFWPIKRRVSDMEIKVVVGLFGVVFLGLSILLM